MRKVVGLLAAGLVVWSWNANGVAVTAGLVLAVAVCSALVKRG